MTRGFSTAQTLTVLLAGGGMVAVAFALMRGASPYGTFADAGKTTDQAVHVVGDVEKDSLRQDIKGRSLHFRVKDEDGKIAEVDYTGAPPSNMAEAKRIVVIGNMKNGRFACEKMLIKCPSKYDSEKDGSKGGDLAKT